MNAFYDIVPVKNPTIRKATALSGIGFLALLTIFEAGFFFAPMLRHSLAASDVDIDPTISTAAARHNGTTPSVVFTDDNTGYAFYVDSTGACVYSKTTDGGTSWSGAVTVDAQTDCLHIAVWYDRWTPGNTTGTMIHVVTDDSGNDDAWYTRLDTSNDTLTTTLDVSGANQGGTYVAGSNLPTITEATDGTIYLGVLDASDSYVLECSSSCDSNITQWTEAAPSPFTNANDNIVLMPLPGAKVMAIIRSVAANTMESKVWSGSAWDSSWTVIDSNAPGNTTYDGGEMGATLDRSTGNIYLAYGANVATPGTDDDIRTAVYDATGGTWTSKTNVITGSSSDGVQVNDRGVTGVKIARDENNGDLYVVYTAQSTPGTATTGNVYFKKSTDGMSTWGSESAQLNTTSDDLYGARPDILSSNRIYATWDEIAVDNLFGNTVAEITPTLTVAATGTQIASTSIPVSSFYVGGAFTFARDSGTATITQIIVSETGTVNANANLSNLILYYKQQTTCSTSSLPTGLTQFNGTGASFNVLDQATTTGTMSVGTSTVCVYATFDVGSGAGSGQTIDIEITNPTTDVSVDFGNITPATAVAIPGSTTLPTATFTEKDFRFYTNTDAVQPTSSLAAEDASTTNVVSGEVLRMRLNVALGGAALATSTQVFKLQYAPRGGAGSCSGVASINFLDVGGLASSTPWRGFNNTSTADGATISTTLLASSTVGASYVEANPTPANPTKLLVGDVAEWDFVVEDHAASSGVDYCFRAVTSAGLTFDSYANYPELTTAPAATWIATEDTATSTRKNLSIRLRIEVSNNGNTNDSAAFKLEYATSTVGPWVGVPVDPTCSQTTADFRECPSNYFLDLDPTHTELTPAAGTFLAGFMLSNSNPTPTLSINTNQYSELEWNIQATDAATEGQTYYFRMTDSGVSIGTYSVYPQINVIAASSTFTQNYYRWYVNANALKPTDPWPVGGTDLGENTAITVSDAPPKNGDTIRLRMSALVGTEPLATSTAAFKLQYGVRATSCSAIASSSWNDVGAFSSSTAWRGFNNASVTDGTALSGNPPTAGDLVLSVSDRAGRYTEENPTGQNPYRVGIGEDVEYDWVLQDNATSSAASYCFRMVQSDGTALDSYTYYPTLTTASFKPASQNWRFYDDETNETPAAPLAAENVAPSGVDLANIVKLRVTVKETGGAAGSNVKFRLQDSTFSDFSSSVSDVADIGSCLPTSTWCYADGAGVDNAVITTKVLSDADSCSGSVGNGCGTHNESGTASSTLTQAANAATEYEFTIEPVAVSPNTTYFFRLIDTGASSTVSLNASSSYPSLVMGGTTLSFTVQGVATDTLIAGVTTTVAATPGSVSFGALLPATSSDVIGANQLIVNTNAPNGYRVYAFSTQQLLSDEGAAIPYVSSTNASPAAWSIGTSTGAFGYHTTDPTLSGGNPTRFAADNTYAAFTNTGDEIAYSAGPVASDTTDFVYRLQISPSQDAGNYSTSVGYVVAVYF